MQFCFHHYHQDTFIFKKKKKIHSTSSSSSSPSPICSHRPPLFHNHHYQHYRHRHHKMLQPISANIIVAFTNAPPYSATIISIMPSKRQHPFHLPQNPKRIVGMKLEILDREIRRRQDSPVIRLKCK